MPAQRCVKKIISILQEQWDIYVGKSSSLLGVVFGRDSLLIFLACFPFQWEKGALSFLHDSHCGKIKKKKRKIGERERERMFLFLWSGMTFEFFPFLEVETTFQNNQVIGENITCRNEILISFESVVRCKCDKNYSNLSTVFRYYSKCPSSFLCSCSQQAGRQADRQARVPVHLRSTGQMDVPVSSCPSKTTHTGRTQHFT